MVSEFITKYTVKAITRSCLFQPGRSYIRAATRRRFLISANTFVALPGIRGNGKSDHPSNPKLHRTRDHIDDLLAVMDKTGTDKAILYGLSYSTRLACIMASYYPQRVEAAILIGTNSDLTPTWDYKTWETWDERSATIGDWHKYSRDYWRENYPDFVDFFSHQVFNEPHSTKQIEDTIRCRYHGCAGRRSGNERSYLS